MTAIDEIICTDKYIYSVSNRFSREMNKFALPTSDKNCTNKNKRLQGILYIIGYMCQII